MYCNCVVVCPPVSVVVCLLKFLGAIHADRAVPLGERRGNVNNVQAVFCT